MLAETRSVDDQVEWLDDDTLLYGLPRYGRIATSDVWSIAATSAGRPKLTIEYASTCRGQVRSSVADAGHQVVRPIGPGGREVEARAALGERDGGDVAEGAVTVRRAQTGRSPP